MDIKAGRYKGRGIVGSEQWGEAGDNNTPQIAVDIALRDAAAGSDLGSMTTFLFFSQAAAPYSFDRLRALGWKGQSAADLSDLSGIDANEVDVEVTEETWDGKTRKRVQIFTGNAKVVLSKPVDRKAFAAKVASMLGNASAPAPDAPKPPF